MGAGEREMVSALDRYLNINVFPMRLVSDGTHFVIGSVSVTRNRRCERTLRRTTSGAGMNDDER